MRCICFVFELEITHKAHKITCISKNALYFNSSRVVQPHKKSVCDKFTCIFYQCAVFGLSLN